MGAIRLDKGFMTAGKDMGKSMLIPVPAFLIMHPKGNVLFDTGMSKDCIDKPDERWGLVAKVFEPIVKKGQDIVSQLAGIGLKPDDIDIVINSHLHLDHAGDNEFFPKAKFLVQRAEIRAAYYPEIFQRAAYFKKDFDHPLNYVEIEGDYDVFGDGVIQCISTPGHSQGHQSLMVNLENSGKMLYTADACYMRENIDLPILPGIVWDPTLTMKNIMKFRDMEQRGIKILPSHDPDEVPKYKKAPAYYD
jgi:glyoxylase-like metal-dependent hydrolase (beta-lactamase superfamily II)